MIVVDTQVILFDALEPRRLSRRARNLLADAEESGSLACSDISLWEIAMLIAKGRISGGPDAAAFIETATQTRSMQVLPITAQIAVLAQSDDFKHGDPADRVIAATAIAHRASLLSADARLRKLRSVKVLW